MQILLMLQTSDTIRVTEASRQLGVARSTAHRLLATMAHRGFVQQARSSRAYGSGPALMEFIFSSAGTQQLREAARPVMERLTSELGETTHLMALERAGVRFIESIEGPRKARVSRRTGTLLPAHTTSGGKILLAELDDDELATHLDRGLRRLTQHTIVSRTALLEELVDIRRNGYAINRQESLDDLQAIAIATDLPNGSRAALAISAPAERGKVATLRRYLPAMHAAAQEITARLWLPR